MIASKLVLTNTEGRRYRRRVTPLRPVGRALLVPAMRVAIMWSNEETSS